ncbi:Chloroperoxidase [Xylariales sp. PMI_506]|nr:Chloroperoxidase [Xylariales sp. PMI_506]
MKTMSKLAAVAFLLVGTSKALDLDSWGWRPPHHGDVRSPCPMLNSLANHGILPHNGLDIDLNRTVHALGDALSIDADFAGALFKGALLTTLDPSATKFSLNNLSNHNVLEHDGSLSRGDFYFGDDHTFNQTIFDQTRSYWHGPFINVQTAAAARLARIKTSQATNPAFNLSSFGEFTSLSETAAYIIVLGDKASGTVPRAWVEYLFEHERLPFELGWSKQYQTLSTADLNDVVARLSSATGDAEGEVHKQHGGIHSGIWQNGEHSLDL